MKKTLLIGIPALVAIVAAVLLLAPKPAAKPEALPVTQEKPSTAPRVLAEGRVLAYPGAEVTVGTDSGGTIVSLPVTEKSVVKKGDLIAEIRAEDLRAALAEASARVAETRADIRLGEQEVARLERLRVSGMTSQQSLERGQRDLDAARARLQTALATVKRMEAVLDKARILAPISGVVTARHAHPGETLAPGARLATIADLDRLRIEAEVDEYDAGRIRLGASVRIRAEGYAGDGWQGKVEEIPDAVVGRKLKPLDPGRPEDTRVLLVKIAPDGKTPLKLGQRVEVEIATGGI